MSHLLAAGYNSTNDLASIDAPAWNGDGDAVGDSDVDIDDFADHVDCVIGPGLATPETCVAHDFDADGDVDLHDLSGVRRVCTGPGLF